MSQQGQGQPQGQAGQVEITIARLYVKDLSYELPRAPQIFQQQNQPEMKVEVNVTPKNIGNNFCWMQKSVRNPCS